MPRKYARRNLLHNAKFLRTADLFAEKLPKHSWVLIGGLAVAHHANPPVTVDMDILFDDHGWDREDIFEHMDGWKRRPLFFATGMRGYPRTGISFRKLGYANADVLFAGKDSFLRRAVRDSQSMKIDTGRILPVISPENLIVMKKLAGREKDDEDADAIWDALEDGLDADYIQRMLDKLM